MLALLTFAARADAPPPAEFWDYLLEYGDASGSVFDPGDLALAAQLRRKTEREKSAGSGQPGAGTDVESNREVHPATTVTGEPTP